MKYYINYVIIFIMNVRIKKALIIIAAVVAVNLALTFGKLYVGLSTNSICVLLDATNSFFDVLTGIITLFAFILLLRPHKLGYGRAEYLATFLVAAVSLVFGAIFAYRSFSRLSMPEPVWSDWISIVIIAVCVPIKLCIAILTRVFYRKLKSPALRAISVDSFLDTAVTFASLLSFTLSAKLGFTIDAIFGIVVSAVIIASAIKLLIEYTKRLLVGDDDGKSDLVKQKLSEYDSITSVGELVMHDYGYGKVLADVKVAFKSDITISDLLQISQIVQDDILREFGININLIPIQGEENHA